MTFATLVTALGLAIASRAAAGDPAVKNQVKLVLQISGLGPDGGEIEIKPGHAACKFEPVVRPLGKVPAGSVGRTQPIVITAESTGADRDCSFAIIVREPGRPPRKYLRGLRLAPQVAGRPVPTQTLPCYLSMPSIAANDNEKTRTR